MIKIKVNLYKELIVVSEIDVEIHLETGVNIKLRLILARKLQDLNLFLLASPDVLVTCC